MNEEAIFAAALNKPTAAERACYLDQVCGDDRRLRAEIEQLLAAHQAAGSFLQKPPAGLVATIASGEFESLEQGVPELSLDFLAPSDKPGCLGRLAQYEVVEAVGRGGMGIVLRAYDPKLNRVVAIKALAPEWAANAMAVKRFLREARAAAAISHDHVVTIHSVDDAHRPPFLVMEFIAGRSLQQKIDREGALEVQEILRIGMQIASGLAAAHKQGMIHRDIKPANILLENGVERVKITDFGLARAADDMTITQTGVIAGTPQYMSPEQALGQPVDARSDLFSLGSVLYAMCTGRPAFRADTAVAVLRRVADDPPRPIREVNGEIPDWLEAIVMKLLAKSRDDRFQSAEEAADLLGRHLAHMQSPLLAPLPEGVMAPQGAGRRCSTYHVRARRTGRVVRWSALLQGELVDASRLTSLFLTTTLPDVICDLIDLCESFDADWRLQTLIPNGPTSASLDVAIVGKGFRVLCARRLVRGLFPINPFAAEFGGNYDVIVTVDAEDQRLHRAVEEMLRSRHSVVTLDMPGGQSKPLAAAALKSPLVERRKAPGAGLLAVLVAAALIGMMAFAAVAIVAFWLFLRVEVRGPNEAIPPPPPPNVRPLLPAEPWLDRASSEMVEARRYEGHTEHVSSLAVSGDGSRFVSGAADGTARVWDVASRRVLHTLTGLRRDRQTAVAMAREGDLVAVGDWDGVVRLWRPAEDEVKAIPAHEEGVITVAFSADGKRLLSGGCDNTAKLWDVESGELLRTLRGHSGWVSDAIFSADDARIATASFDETIRLWDAETGLEAHRLPTQRVVPRALAWSPDGKQIAAGFRDGSIRLFDPEKNVETLRLSGHADRIQQLAFLPDGGHLVSVGYDAALRVWRLADGQEIAGAASQKRIFNALAVMPDGRQVLTGGGIWKPVEEVEDWQPQFDYAIRLWRLPD